MKNYVIIFVDNNGGHYEQAQGATIQEAINTALTNTPPVGEVMYLTAQQI